MLLTHASGHHQREGDVGVTGESPGGDFVMDAKGNPTGLFRETASLIRRGAREPARTPDEERARDRKVLELASAEVITKGISVILQDAGLLDGQSHETMIDEGRMRTCGS